MRIKQFFPHSLFGRFLLIIILPMVFAQIVATYMFYERHWSNVSSHMAIALASEVALIVHAAETLKGDDKDVLLQMTQKYLYLKSNFSKGEELVGIKPVASEELQVLYDHLAIRIPYSFTISYLKNKSEIQISIQMPKPKGLLRVIASKKRFATPTTYIFVSWMIGSATFLVLISILFMRNQVRSISRLAIAAEQFGKGRDVPAFKPTGATEVRQAAIAFLRMKERIERQIIQRTDMLTGVSHDLRTPLTRLKLELAMLTDSKAKQDMQKDIDDMEYMIQEYLDFARGEGKESPSQVTLSTLLNEVVGSYRHQSACTISIHIEKDASLLLRAYAVKRALTNLINNALRFSTEIKLTLKTTREYAIITLEDNGPGIPEEKREEVFKPFYRLDSARNLETAGAGLGLTIARDIITNHGGKIELSNSTLGGLLVTIFLPL